MSKWRIKNPKNDIRLMSVTLGVSEITARVLANRGLASKNAAIKFLNPKPEFLSPWRAFKDMEKAVELVRSAVKLDERVVVYGDYDVDGVTGTVILLKTLEYLGANVSYYIPRREEEGYGLNKGAVNSLIEAETDLLITCDNGIGALEEIALAVSSDVKVIVIDHHEPGFVEGGVRADVVPMADALIDPRQAACPYPFKFLCAASLAYRFAEALFESFGREFVFREEFLVLAGIATVCDIVPLLDENRIMAKNCLALLNEDKSRNPGLLALLEKRGLLEKVVTVFDIGFIIGPCINASGRLSHAADAVRLFTSGDARETGELAEKLVALNEERKLLTAEGARRIIDGLGGRETLDKIIVAYDPSLHESVVGIIAGKVKEAVCRPVVVLTDGAEHVKGSARSIEGYNLYEALYRRRALFLRFGGHAMAAGLTMERENVDVLRESLNADCALTEDDFVPTVWLDAALELSEVTYKLVSELELLAPFGKDNPEPLFGAKGLRPAEVRAIDGKNTLIFTFLTGDADRRIRGVCFGMNEKWKAAITGRYDAYDAEKILAGVLRSADFLMDIVYSPELNEYNGVVSVQVRVRDFRVYRDR